MATSAEREDDHPVEILLEVRPRSVSGDLAPRVAVPEDFRRRAGEIADSVAQVADEFRSRLEHVLTLVLLRQNLNQAATGEEALVASNHRGG